MLAATGYQSGEPKVDAMNDERREGVGFFRGLMAVVRGIAHGFAMLLSLLGRGLAVVTRRSRRHADESSDG